MLMFEKHRNSRGMEKATEGTAARMWSDMVRCCLTVLWPLPTSWITSYSQDSCKTLWVFYSSWYSNNKGCQKQPHTFLVPICELGKRFSSLANGPVDCIETKTWSNHTSHRQHVETREFTQPEETMMLEMHMQTSWKRVLCVYATVWRNPCGNGREHN